MAEFNLFQGLRLRGGFIIGGLEFVAGLMVDAAGRPALTETKQAHQLYHQFKIIIAPTP